jgi:integrase
VDTKIGQFVEMVGDIDVADLKKSHAYSFCRALEAGGKAYKTIKSSVSAMSALLTYCEQTDILDQNPFLNLSLTNFGVKPVATKPFSPEELTKIFELEMTPDSRLIFSILVTTGCRLEEVAGLKFEQVKTDENGITYLDLMDSIVKNAGSKRLVPLPDCVDLKPTKLKGRMFEYFTEDSDGKVATSASKVLMPLIEKVVSEKGKVIHSCRGTLKDLLRDCGVSKETNDYITGHIGGDTASRYGKGPSIKVKYEVTCAPKAPPVLCRVRPTKGRTNEGTICGRTDHSDDQGTGSWGEDR